MFSRFIENADGVGVQSGLTRQIAVGTVIDFVIDPSGVLPSSGSDGEFSARADGSIFSAVISQSTGAVPEPLTATLGLIGLGMLGAATRRRAG